MSAHSPPQPPPRPVPTPFSILSTNDIEPDKYMYPREAGSNICLCRSSSLRCLSRPPSPRGVAATASAVANRLGATTTAAAAVACRGGGVGETINYSGAFATPFLCKKTGERWLARSVVFAPIYCSRLDRTDQARLRAPGAAPPQPKTNPR